jgi:hypothetical protein
MFHILESLEANVLFLLKDVENLNLLKRMKMKIKRMSHLKRRTMIKGEMKLMKTRKMIKKFRVKDRHTQESTKQFNEITLSTPSLVIFIRG